MRDCVFLVADSNMGAAFEGFLGRNKFHLSLGTSPFQFDPAEDLVVAAGNNDPGCYMRAHELLRAYQRTHSHAMVVVDAEWDGSPGAVQIAEEITSRLCGTGWSEDAIAVIVIDPELEVWILQDSSHVERALQYKRPPSLRQMFEKDGSWPDGQAKPSRPKELIEAALQRTRRPRNSAVYRQICSKVTVRHCVDPAFEDLCGRLREWFPGGGQA